MKQEKLSNLIMYYILGGLVLVLALGWLVIRPSWNAAQKTKHDVAVENVKIAQLKQLDADTNTLRAKYDERGADGLTLREQRDRILNQLPPAVQEERLLALLSDLSQQSGVQLTSFLSQAASTASGTGSVTGSYLTFPTTINVSGNFDQIQTFFNKVESAARFIDLQGIQVGSGSTGGLEATMGLQAYYQTPPSATGGQQ